MPLLVGRPCQPASAQPHQAAGSAAGRRTHLPYLTLHHPTHPPPATPPPAMPPASPSPSSYIMTLKRIASWPHSGASHGTATLARICGSCHRKECGARDLPRDLPRDPTHGHQPAGCPSPGATTTTAPAPAAPAQQQQQHHHTCLASAAVMGRVAWHSGHTRCRTLPCISTVTPLRLRS